MINFINKNIIIATITSVVIILLLSACGEDICKKVEESETVVIVTAVDLIKEYNDNVDVADKKYKQAVLAVTGIIGEIEIEEDEYGYINITLLGEEPLEPITKVPVFRVICYFSPDKKDVLAQLELEQEVTVTGLGDGLLVHPVLLGCQVIKK